MKDEEQAALLTFPRAARKAGIATATAERLARDGLFPPFVWLGGRRYVLQVELTEFLDGLRQKEAPHGQG